jgi:hypothetical protein
MTEVPENVRRLRLEIERQVNRKMVPKTLDLLLDAFDGDVDAMRAAVEKYCAAKQKRGTS